MTDTMNLNRVISIKERVAISDQWTPDERDFILECINEAVAAHARAGAMHMHRGSNYLGRIDQIWAFLSIDDGGEGVCSAPINGMNLPLIAADKRRVDSLIPIAKEIATMFGMPVRLAKFSKRDDVEIYQPKEKDQ
jgi:hypothetical protein